MPALKPKPPSRPRKRPPRLDPEKAKTFPSPLSRSGFFIGNKKPNIKRKSALSRVSVLKCASPLALSTTGIVQSAIGLEHSKTMRLSERVCVL